MIIISHCYKLSSTKHVLIGKVKEDSYLVVTSKLVDVNDITIPLPSGYFIVKQYKNKVVMRYEYLVSSDTLEAIAGFTFDNIIKSSINVTT